jgi:rod shape-determining protein MreC
MEHTPPPFFKTGPSALTRLLFFSVLSLAILIADARFKHLDVIRQGVSVAIYPLQRLAAAPLSLAQRVKDFFVSHANLRDENTRLAEENLAHATVTQKTLAVEAENEQLRKLLAARERRQQRLTLAEVMYAARDPFSQRIVIDKGTQHEVQNGQPVIDATGVVGQVTRAYPMLAEVTLISDRGHLVPVLNVRSGLRTVLAGTGVHGVLEMQFVQQNADVQKGDQLVTSGIDGIYVPGLPVAEVVAIEPNPASMFSKVICKPLGGVGNHTRLFVVHGTQDIVPRPVDDAEKAPRGRKGRKGG